MANPEAQDGRDAPDARHRAHDAALHARWHAVVEGYVAAQNGKEVREALRFVHGESPLFDATRRLLSQLYLNYTFAIELLGVHVVGADADYAYLRVVQKTEKVEGPEFKDNVTRSLIVLAQEKDAWKIWAQTILSVALLGEPENGGAR